MTSYVTKLGKWKMKEKKFNKLMEFLIHVCAPCAIRNQITNELQIACKRLTVIPLIT